jgi:hypothetical protein
MAFDPTRKADLFVTVEGSPEIAQRTVASPHVENFYEQQTRLMMNNIGDIVAEGQALRREAEGLIVWRRFMGEGSTAKTWGPQQQAYAASYGPKLRARAVEFTAAVEARCTNPAQILDLIFSDKYRGQYPEDVTKQARAELGI